MFTVSGFLLFDLIWTCKERNEGTLYRLEREPTVVFFVAPHQPNQTEEKNHCLINPANQFTLHSLMKLCCFHTFLTVSSLCNTSFNFLNLGQSSSTFSAVPVQPSHSMVIKTW